MIRTSLIGIRTIRIGGIERGDGVTLDFLTDLIRDYQRNHIAKQFASERTLKGPLKFNKPAYTRSKKDKRRGHKDGILQGELDRGVLWDIKIVRPEGKPGHAYISFREEELIARVPHYKYYRDGNKWHKGKTPGGAGVLIMTKKFAAEVQSACREQSDEAAAGRVGRKRMKEQADRADRKRETKRFRA